MTQKITQWESHEAMDETIRRDTVAVAKALHQSANLIGRWKLPLATDEDFQQSGARNPLDRIQTIIDTIRPIDSSRADMPIKWLNAKNGFLPPVKMPTGIETENDMMQALLRWTKEFGETSQKISEVLEDKRVTRLEMKEVVQEFREDIEAGLALIELLKEKVTL
ncbi:MAG: hypothetical protein KAV87_20975 [Desulfobacteraceae bacterium]|nr:hypothetical protein [Desulfobacteraceae bacterium]